MLHLTREQTRRIDELAMRDCGIAGWELMERAGNGCAAAIMNIARPKTALIGCGTGNNGGDGFVIARALRNGGVRVQVVCTGPTGAMTPDTARAHAQWTESSGPTDFVSVEHTNAMFEPCDIVVDAFLGTGSKGNPREPIATLIRRFNQLDAIRIAIDIPSGLDCDTGIPGEPTFRADWTLTMVAPKIGFQSPTASPYVGQIRVIDLGIAQSAWEKVVEV